ncbi:hypothetical protein BU25DRAFT_181225 [Macroventuria anomochaeta]|uniref:Uncharacterized protein n=1 Tax=Macroventuria anomochaeta TaxID=301207 RepID=A0ACB6RMW2_9PLEO|nr:uncharacterized protein BU25DRAFT_181225 [Macroventuria anomochaeta]KAF2623261.1 hypothetical protein BU25DRAFT_181225 [Macroventuria anomochaeta]
MRAGGVEFVISLFTINGHFLFPVGAFPLVHVDRRFTKTTTPTPITMSTVRRRSAMVRGSMSSTALSRGRMLDSLVWDCVLLYRASCGEQCFRRQKRTGTRLITREKYDL